MRHLAGAMLGAVVVALLASGCTPEPAPSPSPTGFASEEEAFAAAEATYRAYVDAVNARRTDPASEPGPTDFLTGDALRIEIEGNRQLEGSGLHIEGNSSVASVSNQRYSPELIKVLICLDSSASRVVDSQGQDRTPEDRDDVVGLDVSIAWTSSGPLISDTETSAAPC